MGKKADEYKNKVLVENYKQLNRKLVTLSGIGVRQLLGTRPEADSRTEYVTKLALKIDATAAMTEVVLELMLSKLEISRDDFLQLMTEKLEQAVKDLEEDFCITSWNDDGQPIFDLEKYAQRSQMWPR
jgi:hypothetical protein